uniref:Winged helix family transcriptional regulator n=1 Tax=Agrobacterium albertimagni TaxID=147266 RepID=A0A7C1NYB9_9HYPH
MKRFLDLAFDDEMKIAKRGEETIRFSKSERILLLALTKNHGRLMSRDALLNAASAADDDRSDRSIDYVINRLRQKLKDDVKSPRFLATRYGEGYVWLVAPQEAEPDKAFVLIGPCYGLNDETFERPVRELLQDLRQAIASRISPDRKVSITTGPGTNGDRLNCEYSLEFAFLQEAGRIHGRSILRLASNTQIISIRKFALDWPFAEPQESTVEGLAAEIVECIVLHKSENGTQRNEIPLELSMHEASRLLALADTAWLKSGEMIAKKRAEDPEDSKYAIMWASHLYATILFAPLLGDLNDERRAETELEIEALCLNHLPRVQGHAILRICIAKLLFFIDRGHMELVESLVSEVYEQEISFSSVYPLLGQLKAARGHFDEAIRYFDHALHVAETGSKFELYVSVLRLKALLAAGRRQELDRDAQALFELYPETIDTVGLFIGKPDDPFRPQHAAYLDSLGTRGVLAVVSYLYHSSARHFISPEHRERIYGGFAAQVEKRYGVIFVPPDRHAASPSEAEDAQNLSDS